MCQDLQNYQELSENQQVLLHTKHVHFDLLLLIDQLMLEELFLNNTIRLHYYNQ